MSQLPRCSSGGMSEQRTKSATSSGGMSEQRTKSATSSGGMSEQPSKSADSEEMECVVCTREHLDALVEIEQTSFSDPWTRRMLEDTLENPLCVCAGMKYGDRIVAYASMYHILSEGQILSIAVLPEFRRRGIANALFNAFHKYAKDNQMENFYLEVRVSNEAAISFYTKLGFKPMGVRKSYYSSPTEDALLMELLI